MNKIRSFRIVTHAHSNWSYDGSWTVAALAEKLSYFGVHVLMMSEHSQRFDHNRFQEYKNECAAASTEKIRVIPGIEYSSPKNTIHILTWGLDHYLGEELDVDAILDAVENNEGIAVFAHPSRRDVWKTFDAAWAPKLYGMEIWNRKSDGLARSEPAYRLIKDYKLRPMVSLDFHRSRQFYPLYNGIDTAVNIHTLTNQQLVELIRSSDLHPKFLGLPVNSSDNTSTNLTNRFCQLLRKTHRLFF